MNFSIATATFYFVPFEETLSLIKKAGFEYIELDIYWKGGEWEAGQHLKGIKPREVLKMVKDSGLKINSLHDIGGVIYNDNDSLITPDTYEYLKYGADDIPCVVFHTPNKKTNDLYWWEKYNKKAGSDLRKLKGNSLICIENLTSYDGYQVPLINPSEMLDFVKENDIFVNIDTTHYPEDGIDIVHASRILKDYVKGVHISDFKDGKSHLFIGEGELDFKGFFCNIDLQKLHAITLECAIPYDKNKPDVAVHAMKRAQEYLKNIIE